MAATTIKRAGLADQVIAKIRGLIADGTYAVGDRLPAEPELSEMFGVGRSTIREAVRVLSNRGVVRVRHGDGTFVASKTTRESLEERLRRARFADIYEARLLLEVPLAELAARRRDSKDIAAIRKCLKQRNEAIKRGNVKAYTRADFAFHLAIAKAAKSPVLFDVYESFVRTVEPVFETAVTPDYVRNERDVLHGALSEAIAHANVTEARRLVRSHLNTSLKGVGGQLD